MVEFEWAICEGLVLAILVREWFSIRRELRRDAELRAADGDREGADDDDKTPMPAVPSAADAAHPERQ